MLLNIKRFHVLFLKRENIVYNILNRLSIFMKKTQKFQFRLLSIIHFVNNLIFYYRTLVILIISAIKLKNIVI